MPKPNKFYINFTQFIQILLKFAQIFSKFTQIFPNFIQISLKKLLGMRPHFQPLRHCNEAQFFKIDKKVIAKFAAISKE